MRVKPPFPAVGHSARLFQCVVVVAAACVCVCVCVCVCARARVCEGKG